MNSKRKIFPLIVTMLFSILIILFFISACKIIPYFFIENPDFVGLVVDLILYIFVISGLTVFNVLMYKRLVSDLNPNWMIGGAMSVLMISAIFTSVFIITYYQGITVPELLAILVFNIFGLVFLSLARFTSLDRKIKTTFVAVAAGAGMSSSIIYVIKSVDLERGIFIFVIFIYFTIIILTAASMIFSERR